MSIKSGSQPSGASHLAEVGTIDRVAKSEGTDTRPRTIQLISLVDSISGEKLEGTASAMDDPDLTGSPRAEPNCEDQVA